MLGQLIRFCCVGAICLAVTTAGLAALHDLLGMYYVAAFAVSFCFANLIGYLLNGRFTFSAHVSASGAARYLLLNGVLLAIGSLLLKFLVDGAGIWYIEACIIVAALNTPISFLLHRVFSYAARPGPRIADARSSMVE